MKCECCGAAVGIPARGRSRKYCGTRCRVAAHRARRKVPNQVAAAGRWVRHINKRPVTVTGEPASSTRSTTWSTYRAARTSRIGHGLGFVLNGDGIACIDIDDCIGRTGHVADWAQRILECTPPTWIEVSPSGRGLHIWGLVDWPGQGHVLQIGQGHVEIYSQGRYITVTEKPFAGSHSTLANLTTLIDQIISEGGHSARTSSQAQRSTTQQTCRASTDCRSK